MKSNMSITAEQVKEMLDLHASAERRFERAVANNSSHVDEYRAECLAIEQMLTIMGIEY